MHVHWPFGTRRQPPYNLPNDANAIPRAGSMTAYALASIAASALIFSAGAQNVAHGYAVGLASSEFRALVLAAASAGASILGPFCWLAVVRGRGFGPRCAALLLAIGCLAYAGICSLGFVAGSRDQAVSERVQVADAYADSRAVAAAARAELATLKGQTKAVTERRRELGKLLTGSTVPSTGAKPVQADAQAAALAFYIRAGGWQVTDQAVGTWVNFGMVLFLELAAALSLTVAAALRPSHRKPVGASPAPASPAKPQLPAEPKTAATRKPDADDDGPTPPSPRRGKPGRPRDVLPAEALDRIRAAGGRASGSINGLAKLVGSRSKTSCHRLLHQLADMGLVTMTTGPRGVAVALP